MSKHTIVAKLYNRRAEVVKEITLCNVLLDNQRMSAGRYNRLKRQFLRVTANVRKSHYWRMETTDGLIDTFGGYPALYNVRFCEK